MGSTYEAGPGWLITLFGTQISIFFSFPMLKLLIGDWDKHSYCYGPGVSIRTVWYLDPKDGPAFFLILKSDYEILYEATPGLDFYIIIPSVVSRLVY